MGDIGPRDLQIQRLNHLIDSLASLRTEDEADVVLVCDGKEFYAHQLILKASSDYFAEMFTSGSQESNSGKIVFKELDSETLQMILDFLYLGQTDKIKTELQLKNVFKASHLMRVEDLFQYCCNSLTAKISTENFFDLFDFGQTYEIPMFMSELLIFWSLHEEELLSNEKFLLLSYGQLKDYVQFLKSHNETMDNVFLSFIKWVQHDFDERVDLSMEMLDHIEFNLVSKQSIKTLLKSQDFERMPETFIRKCKELCVDVFLSDDDINSQFPIRNVQKMYGANRLTFFSNSCNLEVFYPSRNCNIVVREINRSCYQQLDLQTMSWLPVYDIESEACCENLLLYKQRLFVASNGGVKMYDQHKGTFCTKFKHLVNLGRYRICCFRGSIYAIGQFRYCEVDKNILFTKLCRQNWLPAISLPYTASCITVLATQYHIYVFYQSESKEIRILYNSAPDKNVPWDVLYVATEGVLAIENFFVLENTLQALYLAKGKTMHLEYCHNQKVMKTKTFPDHPTGITRITRICTCVVDQYDILYLSTDRVYDRFRIPHFMWDPKTGAWKKLPDPNGKRELYCETNSLLMQ